MQWQTEKKIAIQMLIIIHMNTETRSSLPVWARHVVFCFMSIWMIVMCNTCNFFMFFFLYFVVTACVYLFRFFVAVVVVDWLIGGTNGKCVLNLINYEKLIIKNWTEREKKADSDVRLIVTRDEAWNWILFLHFISDFNQTNRK